MQILIREKSYSISSISLRPKSENNTPVTTPSSPMSYMKYQNLGDMLKVILYAAESPLGSSPMLYHIKSDNRDIIFIESGILTPVIHYYIIQDKEPTNKWIELRKFTGEYSFVDKIGNDTKSLYIPVLELEKSSFNFSL